ncbi:MAG: NYN domain-containing protein [Actinobacteria bacterium]|nr:NYN domain-containing protein [Actinomycetota bacterium]
MNNYAFIDGQNLHKTVEDLSWFFCYFKFHHLLETKFNVSKAFYYIGFTQDRNCPLYKKLRKAGFQLCLRLPIISFVNNKKEIKANVDSNLITGALTKLKDFDKAIIVAGDSDYYCFAKYLLRQNKLLKILLPSRQDSSNLYRSNIFMYHIAYVDNMKKHLEKKWIGLK